MNNQVSYYTDLSKVNLLINFFFFFTDDDFCMGKLQETCMGFK